MEDDSKRKRKEKERKGRIDLMPILRREGDSMFHVLNFRR
jgi:hypothetical protein